MEDMGSRTCLIDRKLKKKKNISLSLAQMKVLNKWQYSLSMTTVGTQIDAVLQCIVHSTLLASYYNDKI